MEAMTLGLAIVFGAITNPQHEAALAIGATCITVIRGAQRDVLGVPLCPDASACGHPLAAVLAASSSCCACDRNRTGSVPALGGRYSAVEACGWRGAAASALCPSTGFTHNGSALGVYGVAAYGSGLYAMHTLRGTGDTGIFTLALGTTLYGFVFKIADVANVTQWGTSWFHLLAAVGFAAFFIWAETLPLSLTTP